MATALTQVTRAPSRPIYFQIEKLDLSKVTTRTIPGRVGSNHVENISYQAFVKSIPERKVLRNVRNAHIFEIISVLSSVYANLAIFVSDHLYTRLPTNHTNPR